MKVELKEDFYVDENGNKWDKTLYTQEESERLSGTLTNCTNCADVDWGVQK